MKNLATSLMAVTGNREPPETKWDLDYAELDIINAWDISTLVPASTSAIDTYDTDPRAVTFSSDGTIMYILGGSNRRVYYFTLSTPWDPQTKTYDSNFYVGSYELSPRGMTFDPDGEHFYVCGSAGQDVNQYSLSTAWDLSTVSYVRTSSVSSIDTAPMGIFFKPDGTKMYMAGAQYDSIFEFTLSTAWDVSTLSLNSNSTLDISTYETLPTDVFLGNNGLKMYITGTNSDQITEFDLSTAWDLSTASYLQYKDTSLEDGYVTGIFIRPDGGRVFTMGGSGDDVDTYHMGVNISPVIGTYSCGMYFKSDGTKFYIAENFGDKIREYDMSTAWNPSTATLNQDFDVSGYEIYVNDVFFKTDGTKMYFIGSSGDDINEFSLSTAWDISTASYNQNFSVSGKDAVPTGLFFKSDGLTVWVIGSSSDSVHEYSLSTAWDISTMSFEQSFSVSSEETSPQGVHFKDDGTKMFIIGGENDEINEYDLSTAWDISTASFSKLLNISTTEATPQGMWWKPDGSKLYVSGYGNDAIVTFNVGG